MTVVMKMAYTTGEVAMLLGVSARTVSAMVDRKEIKGFRLPRGGDRRIPRENLVAYLESIDHTEALRTIGE